MNSRNPLFKSSQVPNPPILTMMLIIGLAYLILGAVTGFADPTRNMKQDPAIDLTKPYSGTSERALFAGGCFWGTQYSFQQLPGVTKTIVGYTGGDYPNPTYQDVCAHKTKHAETVYVEFDPRKISYRRLVDYFWTIHDPTSVDRQGMDFGNQYRSAIFFTTNEQKAIAEEAKKEAQASDRYHRQIATQIVPATIFYPAEEYHQNYDIKHNSRSCAAPAPGK